MPADELKRSLAFQAADLIPMPVETAVLDFHPLEERHGTGGARVVRGLLVAASRDMVNLSVEAVTKAGLTPVMVDLTPFAVIRSVATTDDLGVGAPVEALVDVGARVTNIIVHQGGVPQFVRILLMGGQDVTDAVAERMGVPQDEAEAMKQNTGQDTSTDMTNQAAGRVIDATLAAFVEEVRGSLDYYLASSGAAAITTVRLTGGGARLATLADRIQAATRAPVEVGNPMDSLLIGRTGLTPEQITFVQPLAAVPVGLALGAA
jgi:type IV pilus assembly protein PilM